jgi:hypothetical protein
MIGKLRRDQDQIRAGKGRFEGIPIKSHNRSIRFQAIEIISTDPLIPFHIIPPANPENREAKYPRSKVRWPAAKTQMLWIVTCAYQQ